MLLLVQTPVLLVVLYVMLYAWHAFGSSYTIGTKYSTKFDPVAAFYGVSDETVPLNGYDSSGMYFKFTSLIFLADTSESDCPVELDGYGVPNHLLDEQEPWTKQRVETTLTHMCKMLTKQPAAIVLSSVFAVALVLVAVTVSATDAQMEVFQPKC